MTGANQSRVTVTVPKGMAEARPTMLCEGDSSSCSWPESDNGIEIAVSSRLNEPRT